MPRVVRVGQLREACERLLDELERRHGAEFDLEAMPVPLAEYWVFNLEDAYTCAESPATEAGDFREDLAETVEMLTREEGEVQLWHDLNHLAGVLRGIAFTDVPRKLG
jgi:hypothetical protein